MRPRNSSRYLYDTHRRNAEKRGIPFLLTFDDWMMIWQQSGRWNQRGNRKGKYCMARHGDRGAYELGNVRICLIEENRAERNRHYLLAGENNPGYGKNYWASHSEEKQRLVSSNISAACLGKPKSAAMRTALAAAATGRRSIFRDGKRTWAYPGDMDYPA